MPVELVLTREQMVKWLYSRWGFARMEPLQEIEVWMYNMGYQYRIDWDCREPQLYGPNPQAYTLRFPDQETCTMFLLRWS